MHDTVCQVQLHCNCLTQFVMYKREPSNRFITGLFSLRKLKACYSKTSGRPWTSKDDAEAKGTVCMQSKRIYCFSV
jgi:hypothetical protein